MIELAEGAPPLADLHPMRALLQIPRNPPPRLSRPEEWSVSFNDVVTECLTKDYESRPLLQEVIEHPLFQIIPKTPTYIQHGLQSLIKWLKSKDRISEKNANSTALKKGKLSPDFRDVDEEMIKSENLANSSEFLQTGKISEVLKKRLEKKKKFTYIGDILLSVDPDLCVGVEDDGAGVVEESEPHIINMCKNIHKKMLHFRKNEIILTSGFEGSNREDVHDSAQATLVKVGNNVSNVSEKILAASEVFSMLTRKKSRNCGIRLTKIMYNKVGTTTGANFNINMSIAASEFFHEWSQYTVFDIVLNGLRSQGKIREFGLELIMDEDDISNHDDKVIESFQLLNKHLALLGFRPDLGMDVIHKMIISIILLMQLSTSTSLDTEAIIRAVANNLEVDNNQLSRALTEVSVNTGEDFIKKRNNLSQTASSLATLLFTTLVDWIENFINSQLQLR